MKPSSDLSAYGRGHGVRGGAGVNDDRQLRSSTVFSLMFGHRP